MRRIKYLQNGMNLGESLLTVRVRPFELKQAFDPCMFCQVCPNKLKRLTAVGTCDIIKTMVEEDSETAIIHLTCQHPYVSYSESSSPSASAASSKGLTMEDMIKAKKALDNWGAP